MTLADCLLTMFLILAPLGGPSRFDDLQTSGAACASTHLTSRINARFELILTTQWDRYAIPLPRRLDRTRLTYKMRDEYAYLGDCAHGLHAYHYPDSICQRVMVRFGPVGTY